MSQTIDFSALVFHPTTKLRIPYSWSPEINDVLQFTIVKEAGIIETHFGNQLETRFNAQPGDILVSGRVNTKPYVVPWAKIPKNYTLAGGQPILPNTELQGKTIIPEQSQRWVARYTLSEPTTFVASWGESMLVEPGDYLVREQAYSGEGFSYYRIHRDEYELTYEAIP